jgi:hypothetical protein
VIYVAELLHVVPSGYKDINIIISLYIIIDSWSMSFQGILP